MEEVNGQAIQPEGSNVKDYGEEQSQATRRAFLGGLAKKALYVTPAVLTLTAQQAVAGSASPCKPNGSPCTDHDECCYACRAATMLCDCNVQNMLCGEDKHCCDGFECTITFMGMMYCDAV